MSAPRPCDRSKNDENVPTTDARSLSLTPSSASSSSAGYMSDMPAANTIVPTTSPATVGHAAIESDAGAGADQRDRAGAAPAEPVGQARAEDAHDEDEHAVQHEDRARAHVEVVDVERHERGEARQRDQPEEQHACPARSRRGGTGGAAARAGAARSTSTVNKPDDRGDEREPGRHDPHRAVVAVAVQHRPEHRDRTTSPPYTATDQ